MNVAGKRVFVTGAAHGCGAGVVRALAAAGARLVATDVDDAAGRALVETLGAAVTYRTLDVADRAAVFRTVDAAAAELGGLDAVIHPAGIVVSGPPEDADMATWDRVFDIHVKGTVHVNQAAFPHLKAAGGGAIVNFASIAGIRGMAGFSVYGAAKGAVLAWTRNVALEWGRHGIRANAVAPAMESRMTQTARASMDAAGRAALIAHTRDATAIRGELGEPERDLAPLVALLVSDAGSYITGQTLAVDGGMMMLGS